MDKMDEKETEIESESTKTSEDTNKKTHPTE